jgi:hypothetical protein
MFGNELRRYLERMDGVEMMVSTLQSLSVTIEYASMYADVPRSGWLTSLSPAYAKSRRSLSNPVSPMPLSICQLILRGSCVEVLTHVKRNV